ncbi:DEAD/DEAH box helicase, partial [Escherichia coli]|uniref:helicase-related protein n=1 Tax=Escherichia coli TaxID=562 RepID=UPI001C4717C3
KLDKVNALIVDEADRMLDLGFSEDLEAISDLAANREQTLMFSATFAPRIITLAERMMNEPERIAIETGHSTNTDITQTLHWTDGFEHKKKLLTHWLSEQDLDQAVVFASTQEDTDMLAEELAEAGLSVVALHGAMPQTVRNRRLRSIREGRAKILVATDVAARGLDVPTISHVINFGLPMKNEDYVHRIG